MKKKIHFVLIASLSVLFFACKQEGEKPHPWEGEYGGKEPSGMISADVALEMTKLYQADKGKAYIDGTERPDALNIWFSLQQLKHYIWQIEDTLRKQGCDLDSMGLGMHIYYAKYPDEARMKELGFKPEYAQHHTAFLTATYKDAGQNVDFDPWRLGPVKCKPLPLKFMLRGATDSTGNGGDGDGDGKVLNNGSLAPPPPNSGTFPETGTPGETKRY